ncbi:hypothetical protein [Acerihabitans arboris]|uniref:Uncharacterized protein n=1 Tax=Acerihabitans arboris TaxID=2691583 RepID=A0A845STQ4_9GAMM|nr:hypothetical protein [Acerihabitans arboris]NDL65851.1 hypothetical protein [Acerihabitans arboris]
MQRFSWGATMRIVACFILISRVLAECFLLLMLPILVPIPASCWLSLGRLFSRKIIIYPSIGPLSLRQAGPQSNMVITSSASKQAAV